MRRKRRLWNQEHSCWKSNCLLLQLGGVLLTIFYLLYFCPFHIYFFKARRTSSSRERTAGAHCSCKWARWHYLWFPSIHASNAPAQSHKGNTLLLVNSHYHWFLFQNHNSFPDLVPFSGQKGYKKYQGLWIDLASNSLGEKRILCLSGHIWMKWAIQVLSL